MKLPSKESLPLAARAFSFSIDNEKAAEFRKAFHSNSGIPPTILAILMKGVFQILNDCEVDWKKLLHGSQSFEYHQTFPSLPLQMTGKTLLKDLKFRAGTYFFSFETLAVLENGENLATSKTLILVKEN